MVQDFQQLRLEKSIKKLMSDNFKTIKYYRKLINKKCFLDFLNFVRDRISEVGIDQENLRFALSGNEIIVELGNRTVLKFEEKEGATCQIGLLVDEEFIELNPEYEKVYRFSGSNPMAYCEQTVVEFSELNIDFKQNHREAIKEYLKVVENSKLSDIRKGSSTDLNSLEGLTFSNKDLPEWFNQSKLDIHEIVKYVIPESNFQEVVNSQDFFFSKLQEFYETFKDFDVSKIKLELEEIVNRKSKFNFQELLNKNEGELHEFILLIGKMISVIDKNAYNKSGWNPYEDSRILAKSGINQKDWTNQLIKFKLDGCQFQNNNDYVPGFRYLMDFTIDPETNFSIASKSHRNLIQQYFKLDYLEDLIDFLKDDLPALNNEANKTYLITRLLYHSEIKPLWEAPFEGLLTLDNTAWFDDFIKKQGKSKFGVVWHNKRPSGTTNTFNSLRKLYKKQSSFPIFYAMKGEVHYKAEVIDFASTQKELDFKNWDKKYGSIYAYRPKLENYVDGDKKAAVVFLVLNLEKIKPIPIKDFKFYNDTAPRQNNLQPVTAIPDYKIYSTTPTEKVEKTKDMIKNTPLNQILYGPPGTGKTYHIKNSYFDQFISKESNITAEQNFRDVVQDLSWWQCIAISLVEGGSSKVSEIMNNKWVKQKSQTSNSKNVRATVWGNLQMHTKLENEYVNTTNRQNPSIFDKDINSNWIVDKNEIQNQSPELFEIIDSVNHFKPNPDKIIKRYIFTTFHQSFSYEDFIEGIKPILSEEQTGEIAYEIQDGIFKQLCKRAENDLDNDYAIFIDEINRGNVSQIFGELITLIEEDKRAGNKEALEITLPYSKEKFSVPNNLYIIGTMNTADRSVEALDSALRRRFSFTEMMPKPELLSPEQMIVNLWNHPDYFEVAWSDNKYREKADKLYSFLGIDKSFEEKFKNAKYKDGVWEVGMIDNLPETTINLKTILETINNRIEVLIDRDHTIGHSYFMGLELKENIEEALKLIFKDKIIPLLQEYFFNDYGKIQLVLGKGFIKKKYENFEGFDFAENEAELTKSDFEDQPIFELVKIDQMSSEEFSEAIKLIGTN